MRLHSDTAAAARSAAIDAIAKGEASVGGPMPITDASIYLSSTGGILVSPDASTSTMTAFGVTDRETDGYQGVFLYSGDEATPPGVHAVGPGPDVDLELVPFGSGLVAISYAAVADGPKSTEAVAWLKVKAGGEVFYLALAK